MRRSSRAGRSRRLFGWLPEVGTQAFLVSWGLLVALPLLWAVVSAFKTDREIFTNPWSLPEVWQWTNFVRAWTQASIGRYFLNSIVVVSGALFLTMAMGSMAAYVLARYRFPGNRTVYYLFIGGMTFPVFLALVPLFFVVSNLGMLGTFHGLILVYTAYSLPFTVFFLTPFFRSIPDELAEAARLDGCSDSGVFIRVMLPVARPGLIGVAIFDFLGLWNQYLLPVVLMPEEKNYVLAQGLASLAVSQGYQSDWSALFAGLTIAMLPMLAMYLLFYRQVQAGLSAGTMR